MHSPGRRGRRRCPEGRRFHARHECQSPRLCLLVWPLAHKVLVAGQAGCLPLVSSRFGLLEWRKQWRKSVGGASDADEPAVEPQDNGSRWIPSRALRSPAPSGPWSGRRVQVRGSRSLREGLFFESVERRTSCRRRQAPIPFPHAFQPSAPELQVGRFGCGGRSDKVLLEVMPGGRRLRWLNCALSAKTPRPFLRGSPIPATRGCRTRPDRARDGCGTPG